MPKKKRGGGPRPFLVAPVAVAVRLDTADHDRLAELAREEQTSISSIVRRAVRAYLKTLTPRKGA